MARALYRKHRPESFDKVVGQDHVVQTLTSAIKAGRISHAYLLTGPKGVGKTSVARILAHEVNNLNYDEETTHLDIIEIDAASNRRIDEIRELRERVHIAPTSAKYKVYIIDEVHMLTREAFNALLKTLEEPPEHVIFILATTEAHKLPETIISRTQRFSFKPVEKTTAVKHMASIAKTEKIDITNEALELLAEHGSGSFRDSISLLDQLGSSGNKIDAESVQAALGIPPEAAVNDLIDGITSGDSNKLLSVLQDLRDQGVHPANLAKQLSHNLRTSLIKNSNNSWIAPLLRRLLEVPASSDPQSSLEISLLEAANEFKTTEPEPKKPEIKAQKTASHATIIEEKIEELKESAVDQQKNEAAEPPANKAPTTTPGDWEAILAAVKKQEPTLYTALRLSEPRLDGNNLELAFQFSLHQKKVSNAKNKQTLGRIIKELTGESLVISSVVDKSVAPPKEAAKAPIQSLDEPAEETPNHHEAISSIFGSAEVLEGGV